MRCWVWEDYIQGLQLRVEEVYRLVGLEVRVHRCDLQGWALAVFRSSGVGEALGIQQLQLTSGGEASLDHRLRGQHWRWQDGRKARRRS